MKSKHVKHGQEGGLSFWQKVIERRFKSEKFPFASFRYNTTSFPRRKLSIQIFCFLKIPWQKLE